MALKISVISCDPAATHLAAYGQATASDFPNPDNYIFDRLLGDAWRTHRVALDMDAVSYLDSAAIGWLIGAQKQFRQAGGFLVLHNVQPHVRNILNLLKVERVVPLCPDLPAATAALQKGPQPQQNAV